MDSIKDLKEEITKLKNENENLIFLNTELQNNRKSYEDVLNDAYKLLEEVPKDKFTKLSSKEFLKSREIIKADEFITNKNINKIFAQLDNFSIEDNTIIFGTIKAGTCTDERFKEFLTKTIEVLPFMLKLYARYYHFTNLCASIDNYEYLGKEIHKRMENIGNR